jgi:hypothetical protein
MLVLLGALSTPGAAQSAIAVGFAATLGRGWQIEGGELGYVRRFGGGPVRAASAGLRVGSFIDEGAILGGGRGIVAAATFGARTASMSLGQMGDERNLTSLGFDLTFELSGYLGSHSPMPQGSSWLAAAVLPGFRIAGGNGPSYALLVGPTVFFGSKTEVRGLLAFRVEAPLARREGAP